MKKQTLGFTLVELMVSMVIGLIILSGIVAVVVSSHTSFKTETEGSFIQENVRYSFEMLTRDIRLAGGLGCADMRYSNISNVLIDDYDGLVSIDYPVRGFEASDNANNYPAALSTAAGSDAVIVRYADPESAVYIKNYSPAGKRFSLHSGATHNFATGDVLAAVDSSCRNVGVFVNTGTAGDSVAHAAGATAPANCDNGLFAKNIDRVNCAITENVTTKTFKPGTAIMEYVTNAYYVADSDLVPGMPALKRRVTTVDGYREEELAQGVESLEIKYGLDVQDDGHVTAYVDADDITNEEDWKKVLAVRVEMVFRSHSQVLNEDREIAVGDETKTDRYMRQLASATVKIRNR